MFSKDIDEAKEILQKATDKEFHLVDIDFIKDTLNISDVER